MEYLFGNTGPAPAVRDGVYVALTFRLRCQMGVPGGGQDADMAQDLLQLNEIDPGLQHMSGKAVAERVARDFLWSCSVFRQIHRVVLRWPGSSTDLPD